MEMLDDPLDVYLHTSDLLIEDVFFFNRVEDSVFSSCN